MRRIVKGCGVLLAAFLVVGCSAPLPTVQKPAPRPVRTEARLHLPAEPVTFDSARATDPAALDLLGNLMEGLVRQQAGGTVTGGVAERWESPDGQTFTFYLRSDARWSDGRQVTATDFVYAWIRALDPQHGSDYAFLLYEIEGAEAWNTLDPRDRNFARRSAELIRRIGVSALDERTLRVALRSPNHHWPAYTAHPVFYPQRASAVVREGEPYGRSGDLVGNGPYVLEQWVAGESIRLRKNLAYWDARSVRLERLIFRIEPDAEAALRLYSMGQLDHVALPGELAAAQQGAQRMAQPSTMGLTFNTSRVPFQNPNLRRAFHLAIDRQRLVDEVAPGNAIPSEGFVPPSLWGGWEVKEYPTPARGHPLQARQLWEIARQELKMDQIRVRLLHAHESEALALSVKAMLQENLDGLSVELEPVPFSRRLERVRVGDFDLLLQGWTADHDDPLGLLELFLVDGAGNDARWVQYQYDQRVREARTGEERRASLQEAERLLLKELPILPLYHPVRHWLTSPLLKGLRYAPIGARLDLKGAYFAGEVD
ncbi:MAG: peptide ABC transporter substrate-binding protein [Bacillota bacterium]